MVRNMKKQYKRTSGEWKDWALLGSAVGHLLQAANQSSTETMLEQTKIDLLRVRLAKDYFEGKLKGWQKAYSVLKDKVGSLEKELSQYKKEFEVLKKQQQEKDAEITRLKKEIENNKNKC
jgi:peptidoglycan hydrolase CwlO-like protein